MYLCEQFIRLRETDGERELLCVCVCVCVRVCVHILYVTEPKESRFQGSASITDIEGIVWKAIAL